MKLKILLASFGLVLMMVLGDSFSHYSYSNAGGAPVSGGKGFTGATFDGRTCNTSGCHAGGIVGAETASITSNVPTAGYTPGSTYTITGTLNTTSVKGGFQMTCLNSTGTLMGTLIATNTTETLLVGSSKYITHKAAGNVITGGTKSWSFDWTAPAAGSGSVTFNGAFNSTNSNGNTSGDVIVTASLAIAEDPGTTGLATLLVPAGDVSIYPVPAKGSVAIATNCTSDMSLVQLIDMSGKTISSYSPVTGPGLKQLSLENVPAGLYFVVVNDGNLKKVEKLVIAE